MQNCIMVALAGWGILTGTLDGLADQLKLPKDDVRACIRQLARERLISIQTQPGGYLTIRVERRSPGVFRATRDRRRYRAETWRF